MYLSSCAQSDGWKHAQLDGILAYHSTILSGVPRNFVRGGGSTDSFEDREKGDLGSVAPYSGVLEAAVIWYKKFHFT